MIRKINDVSNGLKESREENLSHCGGKLVLRDGGREIENSYVGKERMELFKSQFLSFDLDLHLLKLR